LADIDGTMGAATESRPYVRRARWTNIHARGNDDRHHAVKMVGHDDKFIDSVFGTMRRDLVPYIPNHPPRLVQRHVPVHHDAEEPPPLLGTDRDVIYPARRIVVRAQPDRPTVMDVGVENHADTIP